MFSRVILLNLNFSRRMYSTPTFNDKCRFNYKQNKHSNDLHTEKEAKKKKSYEHMYKHLPIKAFEMNYNEKYKSEEN